MFTISEVIGYARALAKYKHTDPIYLAFENGDAIKVTSKSAGTKPELWGGILAVSVTIFLTNYKSNLMVKPDKCNSFCCKIKTFMKQSSDQ